MEKQCKVADEVQSILDRMEADIGPMLTPPKRPPAARRWLDFAADVWLYLLVPGVIVAMAYASGDVNEYGLLVCANVLLAGFLCGRAYVNTVEQ